MSYHTESYPGKETFHIIALLRAKLRLILNRRIFFALSKISYFLSNHLNMYLTKKYGISLINILQKNHFSLESVSVPMNSVISISVRGQVSE